MPGRKRKFQYYNGFRLFLLTTPFLAATLVFAYFPLAGWAYAFFNYKPGFRLFDCVFVGFKYFLAPFQNAVMRRTIAQVLLNTLAMSFLGIATSFLPMIFAVFLAEIRFKRFRKTVQTVTTVPNFISWVLVYSFAYAMFSVNDGFVNHLLTSLGLVSSGINFLASPNHVWLTMWAYATWKTLGWSAIMYVASLSSIDDELYEAAAIDGAGRFRKIWHITIPGLLPTFFVLLMFSIANLLNNGMDQYFVFQNAMNQQHIQVLDLFVYNLVMGNSGSGSNLSYSTAISMLKSVISIVLLFTANFSSKLIRGESIF